MARIVALRAHLERITADFVDGVLGTILQELGAHAKREGTSRAAAPSRLRPRASLPTARTRAARRMDTPARADTPNSVTDPELLLAALEQQTERPSSAPRPRPRASRTSRTSNALSPMLSPVEPPRAPEPPPPAPPAAGPTLRADEVSVRTRSGGVVIKRARRQTHAV